MSKKELKSRAMKKAGKAKSEISAKLKDQEIKPSVFHRCTCPECGEDALTHNDFGVFLQSDFLGITSEGEKGCDHLELEGDYEYVLMCKSCGHRIFEDISCTDEQILDWAVEKGEALQMLPFSCSVCGSEFLLEVNTAAEIVRTVVAVCEVSEGEESEKRPLIALRPDEGIRYSRLTRYRCHQGHELAKDDGSPVETREELVEWLKARQAGTKE